MTTEEWWSRILTCAAFSSVLFAMGCTCVTVQVNCAPPSGAQPSANPGGGKIFGGNFTPVFGSVTAGGTGNQSISCGSGNNISVQKSYVDLSLPAATQIPNPGDTAFVGHLIKSNKTTMVVTEIQSADFVLKAVAGLNNTSCGASMPPDLYYVRCSGIAYPYAYRFKAYWLPGKPLPAANEVVYLQGAWTQ